MTDKRFLESNNFFATDEQVAAEWILDVEGEKDAVRDKEIYPRLRAWSASLPEDADVLEVGCGQGVCSEHIDKSYMGVDPSRHLIERARELYSPDGGRDGFRISDIDNLDYYLDYLLPFNAVFSVNVWMHLQYLKTASEQLFGILDAGGELLIITANPDAYGDWLQMFVHPEITGKRVRGPINTITHPMSMTEFWFHDLNKITEAFEVAGFTKIQTEPFGHIRGFREPAFVQITGSKSG